MKKKPNKRKKYVWKDTEARKKARERGKRTIRAIRLTNVTLTMRHFVNGLQYGPGEMRLPYDLAQSLLHAEGHANRIEEQFHDAGRGLIIGPQKNGGHMVKPVPVESFDDTLLTQTPAFQTPRGLGSGGQSGGQPF
jgi:hypothetical protein